MDPQRRLQTAMKFSLWMWAIYWPLGGILMVGIGMTDPLSLLIALGSLAGFLLVLSAGAVDASSSRSMKEFLIERPLYVIGAAIVLALVGSIVPAMQNAGFAIYSAFYLAGMVLMAIHLRDFMKATNTPFVGSGIDQVAIALVLGVVGAGAVAFDAISPTVGGNTLGASSGAVALLNWLNLAYPPLLLLAMRPFREKLRHPLRRHRKAPAPTDAGYADATTA